MKALQRFGWGLLLLLGAGGCSSTFYSASSSSGYYTDDLYATHDRASIARQQQAEAEAAKAEAEARKALWEARLAEAEAEAAQEEYESYTYDNVLADTYESAYARRLRGFQSLSYNLPSSYYNLRYSPAYHYVTAYDPLNYNIVVMGDEVWVEPKYISSMFGTWGAPRFSLGIGTGGWYGSLYYDWLWPYGINYSWWGYPRYSWWDWNWNWHWASLGWPHHHHSHPGYHGPGLGGHKPAPGGMAGHYPNYRPAPSRPENYRGQSGATPNRSTSFVSPRYTNYRSSATTGNYRGSSQGVSTSKPGSGSNVQAPVRGQQSGTTNYRTPSSGQSSGATYYRGQKSGSTAVTQPGSSSGKNSSTTNYRGRKSGTSSTSQSGSVNKRREENNSSYRSNSSSSYRSNSSSSSNYRSGSSSSGYRSSGSYGGGSSPRSGGGGNYRGGR